MPWLNPSARSRLTGAFGHRPARDETAAPEVPAVAHTPVSPDALVVVEGIEFEMLRPSAAAWVPSPASSLTVASTQASSLSSGDAEQRQTSSPNSSVASLEAEVPSSRGSHVTHHAQLPSAHAEPVARGRATLVTSAALRGRWRRPSESAAVPAAGHHAREHSAPASRRTSPAVPLPPRQPTVASGHQVTAAQQLVQTRISTPSDVEPQTTRQPASAAEDERDRALAKHLLRAGHGARLRRGWGTPSLSQPTPAPSILVTPPMPPSSWSAPTNPSPSYAPLPRGPLHPAAPRAGSQGVGGEPVAGASHRAHASVNDAAQNHAALRDPQPTHARAPGSRAELHALRAAMFRAVGELTAALHGVRRLPLSQAVARLRAQAPAWAQLEQGMLTAWPQLPRASVPLREFEDDALAAIDLWRNLLATATQLLLAQKHTPPTFTPAPRVYFGRASEPQKGGRGLRLHVDDVCFALPQPELHRLLDAARHKIPSVAHALQAFADEVAASRPACIDKVATDARASACGSEAAPAERRAQA